MITKRLIAATAVLAGLALSACGNSPELRRSGFGEVAPDLRALLTRTRGDTAQAARLQPTPGFPGLDPALIAGQTNPLMSVYLQDRQALAGLAPVESARGVVSWRTADQVGMALTGSGLMVSTRGLGQDLHAADISQTAAAIASGQGGTVERRHVYLDGIYQPVEVVLTCTIRPAARETLVLNERRFATVRFDESCTGAGVPVSNRYWRDETGPLIRQSSQWVGPEVGMAHLQRLIE